jgi:hypothetical protein
MLLQKGQSIHTLLLGRILKIHVAGITPLSPLKITRCKAQPGISENCAADYHRKVELEPLQWLPQAGGALGTSIPPTFNFLLLLNISVCG